MGASSRLMYTARPLCAPDQSGSGLGFTALQAHSNKKHRPNALSLATYDRSAGAVWVLQLQGSQRTGSLRQLRHCIR
jgi:hypothetical protein